MSSVLNEVLEANSQYSSTFGVKGDLALSSGTQDRDSYLHGCPSRSGEVCRAGRG